MVLTNPLEIVAFLQQHAKSRNLGESVVTNVVAGVLFLVSLVILSAGTAGASAVGLAVMLGIGVIVFLLVGLLVIGWIYSVALGVLGSKKSTLYEGFTTFTLSVYPLAIGFLIFAVLGTLGAVSGNAIVLAVLGGLGLLALIVTGVVSVATFYRATKDLFAVDYITTYIAGTVFGVALSLSLALALGTFAGTLGLSLLSTPGLGSLVGALGSGGGTALPLPL